MLTTTLAADGAAAGFDLGQFYQVFFEEAGDNLGRMEQLLVALDLAAPDDETLHAIFRCAHSIKGGAATFGFGELADLTHVMETLLDRLRRHELAPDTEMVDTLLASGDALREMLRHRQEGSGEAVDDRELRATLVRLASPEEAAPAPVAAPAPTAAPVAAVAAKDKQNRDLELLAGPLDQPGVADDLIELFGEVVGLGELTRAEAVPGQADGVVRFRLKTTSSDGDLLDLCGFHLPREQLRIADWPGSGALPVTAPVAPAAPAAAPAPAASRKSAAPAPSTETLRVSVDKVDQLINLMGELVITQAMLAQRAGALDGPARDLLIGGLTDLERTTRDLQESVMSIRMIPMSEVFGRFPRMLRDLAARLGKQVELRTIGEATELDKGMIEKLTDPLTHLVRNSLDHGIELPEQRLAAGKAAQGTLTLSAQHEGGCILIQVRDDGRGLDRARILAKARSNGMPVHDGMTDAEVWQLIFAPGFSTAEAVTDVSGRGVGMDVVRRNILSLGGSVELSSEAGAGSCVSVRLPLTLAIMDGMSVMAGGELYLLPLSSVVESFQPTDAAIKTVAGDARVVKVREEYLPVVSLSQVLSLPPAQDAILMHVVIEGDGRRIALEVDQLVGQQQVVVKNLEANYRKVPGVSGATILGDGRVALILDVAALVRRGRH
jgi:two-component system chemotaxis sensor kinase CheA